MAEATLNTVIDELVKNKQAQIDADEKQQQTLEGVSLLFSRFFLFQKRKQLDELEAMRESRGKGFGSGTLADVKRASIEAGKLSGLAKFAIGTLAGLTALAPAAVLGLAKAYKDFYSKAFPQTAARLAALSSTISKALGEAKLPKGAAAGSVAGLIIAFQNGLNKITSGIQDDLTKRFRALTTGEKFAKEIGKFIATLKGLSASIFAATGIPAITKEIKNLRVFLKGADSKGEIGLIRKTLNMFKTAFSGIFGTVLRLVSKLATPVIVAFGFFKGYQETEGDLTKKILGGLTGAFEEFFNFFIKDVIKLVSGALAGVAKLAFGDDSRAAKFILDVEKQFERFVDGFFGTLKELIQNPKETSMKLIDSLAQNFYKGVASAIANLIGLFSQNLENKFRSVAGLDIDPNSFDASNVKAEAEAARKQSQAKVISLDEMSGRQKQLFERSIELRGRVESGKLSGEELQKALSDIQMLQRKSGTEGVMVVDNSSETVYAPAQTFIQDYATPLDKSDR